MQHRVAVRADWPKVIHWIELVLSTNFAKRFEVMHMNVAGTPRSELGLKVETAHGAVQTPAFNTSYPC